MDWNPEALDRDRAQCGEKKKIVPAFAQRDGGDAGIEQRDVTESRPRMIAGSEEEGRKKTANQTEHDHDLRVHAHREEEGRDRDERHERERNRQRDQVVERVRAKRVGVEDEDAGGAKALAGHAVIASRCEPTRCDQHAADDHADDDAHRRRDEVVVERVLHQKDDGEEENESADPGEELHSHESFPIDRGTHRARDRRRCGEEEEPRQARSESRRQRAKPEPAGGAAARGIGGGDDAAAGSVGTAVGNWHWRSSAQLRFERFDSAAQFLQRCLEAFDFSRVRNHQGERSEQHRQRDEDKTRENGIHLARGADRHSAKDRSGHREIPRAGRTAPRGGQRAL